jgi:hypothetical protein
MAGRSEELSANGQVDRTLVARRMKDLVEERLFARRRSLVSDLSVVFMDTTLLYLKARTAPRSANAATPRIIGHS